MGTVIWSKDVGLNPKRKLRSIGQSKGDGPTVSLVTRFCQEVFHSASVANPSTFGFYPTRDRGNRVADGSVNGSRTHDRTLPDHAHRTLGAVCLDTASYFNFTKSKTKIAQTPTVTGN